MWKGVSNFLIADILHCVKSVQIRGFFWFVLSRIWTEYGYLLQSECGKIWTGKNSVNGYFSPSINRAIFSRKFVIYYFFLSFCASKCCGCNYLMQERHRDVLHGMHSPIVAVWLTFRSFWWCLIVFVQMICLNDVFLLKAMTGVALNTFLNVFLIFGHVYIYQTQLCISRNFKKVFWE